MKYILLISALIGTVNALCPQACSGHGKCGNFDKCKCYSNWQGPDCSLRTCHFTSAWADSKDTSVTGREPHYYAECGNKGTCKRDSGLCECFDGYEGKGCERLSCIDNCNNHGTCETIGEVNYGYTGWDKEKIMYCKCDPGYSGPACENRMCKPGDDPMSVRTASGSAEEAHKQKINIAPSSGNLDPTEEFYLKYTDWRGETWNTWVISVGDCTGMSIRQALEGLPNHAIPDITIVSEAQDSTTYECTVEVQFSSKHTTGTQPMVSIQSAACAINGCQPRSKGLSGGVLTTVTTESTSANHAENLECSGRGHCDSETGTCVCVEGYYGESCDAQTTII